MANEADPVEAFGQDVERLREAVAKAIVGQREVVDEVLVCLFAGGHALLEGAPGLGKTLLVRTLARAMELSFSRIQFTPDLMPSDVVGTRIIVEDDEGKKAFELSKGPIFGQLVLADEINRATPKTQSALLEAMAEQSVTLAGEHHALELPFCVIATENPIEMEGTYPLPEAQLDRFLLKILVPSPDQKTLVSILEQTTGNATSDVPRVLGAERILEMRALVRDVRVATPLTEYVARLVRASDPEQEDCAPSARALLRYGAGVRGGQAMLLAGKALALMDGRSHVSMADLRRAARPALRHRLITNFEADADGIDTDDVLDRLLDEVSEVPESVEAMVG